MYVLTSSTVAASSPPTPQALIGTKTTTHLWHLRLGHPSSRVTALTLNRFYLPTSNHALPPCSACAQAKAHALPPPLSPTRVSKPFRLLFIDVWGLALILSSKGCCFYLSIVDNFSKYIWIFPMQSKSSVSTLFLAFSNYVKNCFSSKIISVQSDWGGEFRPLHNIFKKIRISYRITCPYSHQQNESVERRHKHIVETGIPLLAHSSMP